MVQTSLYKREVLKTTFHKIISIQLLYLSGYSGSSVSLPEEITLVKSPSIHKQHVLPSVRKCSRHVGR